MTKENIQKLIDNLDNEYNEISAKIDEIKNNHKMGEIDKEIEIGIIDDVLSRRRLELEALEEIRDDENLLKNIPDDYIYNGDIVHLIFLSNKEM